LNATECLVALANLSDYAEVNRFYAAAFSGADAFPARAAFQVVELPKAALVEIKCTGVSHHVVVATPKAPAAIGPYSQATFDATNGVLYAAGQIGLEAKTGILVDGVHNQTVQALRRKTFVALLHRLQRTCQRESVWRSRNGRRQTYVNMPLKTQ